MPPLVACPGCSTHVGAGERSCPFCARELRGSDGTIAQTTAAVMLGLSAGAVGCQATPVYGIAEDVTVTTTSGVSPTGGPPCGEASPIPPDGPFPSLAEAQAMCDQAGEQSSLDAPGVRAWLPRRWFFCKGQPVFGREHTGIEFVPDTTWYFLDQAGDELVRGPQGGTWSAEGPACTLSDVIVVRLDQSLSFTAFFSIDPLKLALFSGGEATEYVAVGDGAVRGAGGSGGRGGAGGAPP